MGAEHLTPAPWTPQINSLPQLRTALAGSVEFTCSGVASRWYGATTTGPELKEQGVTHVQVRYGKNHTKTWYGKL